MPIRRQSSNLAGLIVQAALLIWIIRDKAGCARKNAKMVRVYSAP
jgi:hypothetical protein